MTLKPDLLANIYIFSLLIYSISFIIYDCDWILLFYISYFVDNLCFGYYYMARYPKENVIIAIDIISINSKGSQNKFIINFIWLL